jgi:serine/threonine protein kinase
MSSLIGGNPDYMAPEVYTRKYKSNCDLYSIGVLICELYYNDNEEEKKNILYEIKNDENFNLPKDNELIKDLIKKTIQIDPQKRISWDEYFKHEFFEK